MGKSSAAKLIKRQQEDAYTQARAKAEAFIADYQEIKKKHGLRFVAKLKITEDGVNPHLQLEVVPPNEMAGEMTETKPWSEARAENLKTRMECTHVATTHAPDKPGVCKVCGLEISFWGEDNKGVTEEYKIRTEEQIAALKEKEAKDSKATEASQEEAEDSEAEAECAEETKSKPEDTEKV